MPLIIEKEIRAVAAKTESEKILWRKIEPDNWIKPTKYFLTIMYSNGRADQIELSKEDAKKEEDLIFAILDRMKNGIGILTVTQEVLNG